MRFYNTKVSYFLHKPDARVQRRSFARLLLRLYRQPIRGDAIRDTGHARARCGCGRYERNLLVLAMDHVCNVAGQERLCKVILNVRMVVWINGRVVLRRRERHADGYERVVRLVVRGDR